MFVESGEGEGGLSQVNDNSGAGNGGGIYAYLNVTLDGAPFGTTGQPSSAGGDGGGLCTATGHFYIQEGSLVEGNTAGRHGGDAWGTEHGIVENSTVRGNLANDDGGGIDMENFQSLFIDMSLTEANESGMAAASL